MTARHLGARSNPLHLRASETRKLIGTRECYPKVSAVRLVACNMHFASEGALSVKTCPIRVIRGLLSGYRNSGADVRIDHG